MAFRTKLDFSNNRQVKQHIETTTVLSGATNFGVPFSDLPTGINPSTTGETEFYSTILSTFSGNSSTTVYTWYDPRMQLGAASLSAITPTTSAITQTVDPVFTVATTTVIDGNTVGLTYTGVTFDINPIAVYDLGGGNYSGTVETDYYSVLSATSIDFTGRTIWVDVSGITRTERLIITNNPVVGHVWTCIDSEGMGEWQPSSGSGSSIWVTGTGFVSAILNGSGGVASGDYTVAEGTNSQAIGSYSHAEGKGCVSSGSASHAEGEVTEANGQASHTEGSVTKAYGVYSHAEGWGSIASGYTSHAEGGYCYANGDYSHAEGVNTQANGFNSHAEGNNSIASGSVGHAEGTTTEASGDSSHAQGESTLASGNWSHAEGYNTIASNRAAHAEGQYTLASGEASHAEGYRTSATTQYAHSEGQSTHAFGDSSHAEGFGTFAKNAYSHAEGYYTTSNGDASHAEGYRTSANGNYSHAGGWGTIASGDVSFVHGSGSTATTTNTIVLGANILGSTANTTYVDYLNVKRVLSTAFANDIRIDANGNLTTNTSDERLKENINPLTGALDKIKNLKGVTYQWKDRKAGGDAVRLGFIAQQVEKVEPLLVFTNTNDDNRYKGLHIDGIIPLLVEAVKELATSGVTESKYLQTQTILAEDNNIDLNYNGTPESAVGGGIRVLNAKGLGSTAEITTDSEGNWVTNNDFKPNSLTIPQYTPTSSSDEAGVLGNVTRDDDYIYIKTSTGWKRANLESF